MLNYRFFCIFLLIITLGPNAIAEDRLADIIAEYDVFLAETDPVARSRQTGEPLTRWPDVSPTAHARHHATLQDLSTRLSTLTPDETGHLDHAILSSIVTTRLNRLNHDIARIPFTADWGFHAEPVFWAESTRLYEAGEAEAYIERLKRLPNYIAAHIQNMRRGVESGFTAHGAPLAVIIGQISEQAVAEPAQSVFYQPLETFANAKPDQYEAIRAAAVNAVASANQAYQDLLDFLTEDYAPYARTDIAIASLKGGQEYYTSAVAEHTTRPDLTPEDIHQLGLSEVVRLRAEMDYILGEAGFDGAFEEFLTFLRTHPGFYANRPEELLEKAALITRKLDAILPRYFGKLPRLPYGVAPVPPALAPGYTTARYAPGNTREQRAATYFVNTYRLDQRPLYELPALSAHEAVPGHHLQISLAQELEDVPAYRKSYFATAFGEGWALYAEQIAWEAGIYETPYERFGALSYQMWRACRLVADTGLHWYGWSREQAEACFLENTALSALNVRNEVTRYIGWPGQALGYKIGALTIRQLRQKAETDLGDTFDLRSFHDAVLGSGSLPLSALEQKIHAWIDTQKRSIAAP